MKVSFVSIYCLPNIRHPWVVVYEPHPWGCGALRVKESSAILIMQRMPSRMETEWMNSRNCYTCVTFAKVDRLIEWEDGQHEMVSDLIEAIEIRRKSIDLVLAATLRKQAEKRRKIRMRDRRVSLPVV